MISAQAAKLLDALSRSESLATTPVGELRDMLERAARRLPISIPTTFTDQPLLGHWSGEARNADCVVLFLHGGGFSLGSSTTHLALSSLIAATCGRPVFSLDYRLAPEHPFPAAIDDVVRALDWLRAECAQTPIVLCGDSAGANVGVAASLAAPERVLGLAALSPWFDLDRLPTERSAQDPMGDPQALQRFAAWYCNGAASADPSISPVYADLRGLPRTLVQYGGADLLRPGVERFIDRAKQCGVDVDVDFWPELFHDWQFYGPVLPEAAAAVRRVADFVAEIAAGTNDDA